ncbi:small-conductance mechanosensitive channel [Methanohalophilus levihalophilus]|uniref:mechanosensitive ion channel family protein n=1 Tax=Methanohalophilus levihalophilus TaxID=1431282 RepID=UPI001AE7A18B|nr:mechanosensitive ion channel family protein [Methanohalophilus levihalophilus]MBP2031184.1 small-conductance mechanosensitive channel [Methanohalophilus levihalophilus]
MANGLDQTLPYTDISLSDILFAIIILIIGYLVARMLTGLFSKGLKKTKLPELVVEFLTRFLSSLLYVIVILAVLSVFVNMSAVVLGLSAVIGLILGFGMQDTLTNIGAGLWIAALRPIDKNEYVEVNGSSGTVSAVGIMATELLTPDNKIITIPNSLVWGSPIVNATRMPTRRVDVNVGISYSTDLDRAIEIALYVMKGNQSVLNEPAPAVVTTELADSSVNLQLRAWVKTADYWAVKGDLTNNIFKTYNEQGIEIPFPQLDVHLTKE